MRPYSRKIAAIFFALMLLTCVLAYICLKYSFVRDELLPSNTSTPTWKLVANTDEAEGGSSSISLNDTTYSLDFDFFTTNGFEYPYVNVATEFVDSNSSNQLIDLSMYSSLVFTIKCDPKNVLAFTAIVFDEKFTVAGDVLTYRLPTMYFSCENEWKNIQIALKQLNIPEWWLTYNNIDLSDQSYSLSKVYSLQFSTSKQSPRDKPSNVKITRLTLQGWDWHFFSFFVIVTLLMWGAFVIWAYKQVKKMVVADITNSIQKEKATENYKHLSMEPRKDRDKTLVLRYMTSEYANPDLNLETASKKLGINRNKINEILRDELGLTFNTYLNKLRLNEAARLLTQEADANVAEVAGIVGYNNSSYFTKLFKQEYGLSPSNFKNKKQEK